jgi:flagellar protein FlaF
MYGKQLEAYKTTDKATMSGREIEASVLTQAALKLKNCQDNWEAEDREDKLLEAFRFNQLIWSIFQGELVKADHPLPKQIRQDILSLSAFVDKRIFDAMAYPAPEKLTAIININLNIAAGLRGSPGE